MQTTPTQTRRKRPSEQLAPPAPPRPALIAASGDTPPGVAERVYEHVCRLATEHGMLVREIPSLRSLCLVDAQGPRPEVAVGLRIDAGLPPLAKAWRIAVCLGEVATFRPGFLTWQVFLPDECDGDEQNMQAAEGFASSLVASLTAAELVKL